jgi:hypothetical protein
MTIKETAMIAPVTAPNTCVISAADIVVLSLVINRLSFVKYFTFMQSYMQGRKFVIV